MRTSSGNAEVSHRRADSSMTSTTETPTTQEAATMDNNELQERLHAVEVAQATGAATLAGSQTTQAAAQAGTTTTVTAMNAGTVGMMATGSVALVVGIFLGIVIRSAR